MYSYSDLCCKTALPDPLPDFPSFRYVFFQDYVFSLCSVPEHSFHTSFRAGKIGAGRRPMPTRRPSKPPPPALPSRR